MNDIRAAEDRWSDRLLPLEEPARSVARRLHGLVVDAPIISPHGHVPAELILANEPFHEPSSLFLSRDHYIYRMLHSAGVDLEEIIGERFEPRAAWRRFAEHQALLAGTASDYWFSGQLRSVFGIERPLTPESADEIYDVLVARIAAPDMRPRALLDRFRIGVLATTDDPLDDLDAHRRLRDDPSFTSRVIPTFRPDKYIDPEAVGFATNVDALVGATGRPATFAGYLDALRERREHFIRQGAVSLDVGVIDAFTADMSADAAERLFARVMSGAADDGERRAFRGHVLLQLAGMSVDDGLTMTIHVGVVRGHSPQMLARFGADTGHDIPTTVEFTRSLRPLLDRFGLEKDLRIVLFCIDEAAYGREIAPLAGFYPSVFVGAPWWFLDAPESLQRWRSAVTEVAGFYRTSGFIDDTRAFLSIPSRHDMARRSDAAFLARYVTQGRMSESMAERIIRDTVDAIPRNAFHL